LNLTLRTTKDGLRLFANPVEEFKQLRMGKIADWNNTIIVAGGPEVKCDVPEKIAEVELSFEVSGSPEGMELQYGANRLRWDFRKESVGSVPAKLNNGTGVLRLIIDRPFAEMFVNDGAAYELRGRPHNTNGGAGEQLGSISLKAIGKEGKVTITEGAVYRLNSIWQ